MAGPFIGEIKIWAGNFAPQGYVFCDGRPLTIGQYSSLYSIIGKTYGGDLTTFCVPNLGGRAPMGAGEAPGLTPRILGQMGGSGQAALSAAQMAGHNHDLVAAKTPADQNGPANHAFGRSRDFNLYGYSANTGPLNASAVETVGGGQPHPNVQPYLSLCFIIAVSGVMPKRPNS